MTLMFINFHCKEIYSKSLKVNSYGIVFLSILGLVSDEIVLKENEFLKNVPAAYIQGAKNSTILVDDLGFCYRKGYKTFDCQYWQCSKVNRLKCRALCKVKNGVIVLQRQQHNHGIEAYKELKF